MSGILAFIIAILILTVVHEYGHFLAARALGVKVLRFSFGFGRVLYSWVSAKGTEFSFSLWPLGGYVKMLDCRESDVPAQERALAFDNQAIWKRLIILLGGPVFNILFAILVYWGLFTFGITYVKPIVGSVVPHSVAAGAGVRPQEKVLAVDTRQVMNWRDAVMAFTMHLGDDSIAQFTTTRKIYELPLQHWRLDPLKPKVLQSIGIIPYRPPVPIKVNMIEPGSSAQSAGLKPDDIILRLAGQSFSEWQPFKKFVKAHPGLQTEIVIQRSQHTLVLPITLGEQTNIFGDKLGVIGLKVYSPHWQPQDLFELKLPVGQALGHAIGLLWVFGVFNMTILCKMLAAIISFKSLMGPLGLYQAAEVTAMLGIAPYFDFLALVSFAVAFVNLLPIPGLDGGHIVFLAFEKCLGRPVSLALQVLLFRLGVIFLGVLFMIALGNDLQRLAIVLS